MTRNRPDNQHPTIVFTQATPAPITPEYKTTDFGLSDFDGATAEVENNKGFDAENILHCGDTMPYSYETEDGHTVAPKLVLPATPPLAKHRISRPLLLSENVTSSPSNIGTMSSLEASPMRNLREQGINETRSNSADSGHVSVQRQSMDSGVSNRFRSTESEASSPAYFYYAPHHYHGRYTCFQEGCQDNGHDSGHHSNDRPQSSRDEGATYAGTDVAFHKGQSNEKYMSTASDRAADHEVSSIMTSDSPKPKWPTSQPVERPRSNTGDDNNLPVTKPNPKNLHPTPLERSPVRQRRREVASLLRQKKRHGSREPDANIASNEPELSDYQTRLAHQGITAGTAPRLLGKHESIVTPRIHAKPETKSTPRINLDTSPQPPSSTTPRLTPHPSKDMKDFLFLGGSSYACRLYEVQRVKAKASRCRTISYFSSPKRRGISSTDTHRSSVRYEPVIGDHSCTPPSPGRHSNRRKLLGNRSTSSRNESESDVDEIDDDVMDMDDVTMRGEERPLNSRRRLSSPVIDHRTPVAQYGQRRGSSYMARTNSGSISGPNSTQQTEPRMYSGIPRMGTGVVAGQMTSQSNHHPASSNLHNHQQSPASVMTSRVSATLPLESEQYNPVVTTTLKPTYEVDETGLWSFSRGNEAGRATFGGYTSGIPSSLPPHTSAVTSSGPGSGTTARFMNKRPSFGGRYDQHIHRRESRQYDGTFEKLRGGCWGKATWKCAALTLAVVSALLLALAAFFLVRSMSPTEVIELPGSAQCVTGHPTTVVDKKPKDQATPMELQMSRPSSIVVPPSSFSWMQVYVEEPTHMKFNCSVSPQAEMAVYGRKGLRPTHTKFDFFEKIDGGSLPSTRALTSHTSIMTLSTTSSRKRSRRSVNGESRKVNLGFVKFLDAGTWHVAVYNDAESEAPFEIITTVSKGLSDCPKKCNNNGDCVSGVCACFPGYQGSDCSQASCSVTCRGNGVYAHGKCVCFSGWKGVDCATPSDQCVHPECSNHGSCDGGECVCERGYKGEACEQIDCFDPSCSGHGVCVTGVCRCDRGWSGSICTEKDSTCFTNCAGHGTYDATAEICICDAGWGGNDCVLAQCRPACQPGHGACVNGVCRCEEGWTGDACHVRQCDSRCEEHGSCSEGVCICDVGWNGDICTFPGCPNDCSGNGNCVRDGDGGWYCSCDNRWKSDACDVQVELHCSNMRDDDLDTLRDCQDPDCCSHPSCTRSSQCRGGLDPSTEVARIRSSNPLPTTASFHQRTFFLVNRNGVQINADGSRFDPKRTSVIRGKVITADGSPLIGVQVKVEHNLFYGITKTRANGWYDILVNGGGSLTLNFQRTSFVPSSATVFVPWNDFVVMPTVTMRTPSQPSSSDITSGNCDVSKLPEPDAAVLVSSVRAYSAAECSERGSVIPEIQAIRESVPLPGTDTSLVYLSSRAMGYQSLLVISLVNKEKPANLVLVHLRIVIQGVEFRKKFEPRSELTYTYEWSREDAYGQPVYGSIAAKVYVGYVYDSCNQVVWKSFETTVEGRNPVSDGSIGLWSLAIHHTYHPSKGVVYLGNGGLMRLSDQPPIMATVMGNGNPRHSSCDGCNGRAENNPLRSPVALTSDAMGNVYVGDHDYIRKIDVRGQVTSLFSTRDAPAKYYMAIDPTQGGLLYFSHPNERRIYRLRQMTLTSSRSPRDLTSNYEVVAGSGRTCYPLQEDDCGDFGLASEATLSAPKGLTFDKDGVLYFIDGNRIRNIHPRSSVIQTFAGSILVSGTRPLQCQGSMSLDQLELTFPTDIAASHVDGNLYVLDGDVIIRIDVINRQASLAAGIPLHCMRSVARNPDNRDARKVSLISPTSITVSPLDGAIYISETDRKFVHRVRRIDPSTGRISSVAGVDSDCDCALQQCLCFLGDGDFARSAALHDPAAVTATPDGSVYIADQLNLKIRKIHRSLPSISRNNEYNVSDPDTNHLYVFDQNGRHIRTRNVITGAQLYSYAYSTDGGLRQVTDSNGNHVRIEYASNGKPVQMSLPNRKTLSLTTGLDGTLTRITRGTDTPLASFTYQGDGNGLIRSSVTGRYSSSFYAYDVHGRLITATSSTGAMTSLHAIANATRQTVTMKRAAPSSGGESSLIGVGRRDVVITTEPGYLCDIITTTEGAMTTTYERWTDNSISVRYLDDSELTLETKPHPVLGLTAPFLAKRTIQLPADPLENKIEWSTRKERENGQSSNKFLLGRRMLVNGRNILSLDYSQAMKMDRIYDDHTKFMLRIQYDSRGLPTLWMPSKGITPVNVTYDQSGHAVTWQRGPQNENLRYDVYGNLQSAQRGDGQLWRYTYGNKISHLSLSSPPAQYTFTYDDNQSLQRVTLPSGLSFAVDRRLGIGFIRHTFLGSTGKTSLIIDRNDKGEILSSYYPGEKRKVIYRYDAHGHMTEVLHDSARTRMLRDPQSGELVSVATDDCTMRFHRNGPLVQRHTVTSSKDLGMLAVFDYTHDVNLRLQSIHVKINSTELPLEELTYNDVSGKLTTFGRFTVIDLSSNLYTVSSQEATLTKQSDSSGRIVQAEMEVYSAIVFSTLLRYEPSGRISSEEYKIGIFSNKTSTVYSYNQHGGIRTAAKDGRVTWRYSYDSDGRLSQIENDGVRTSLRYNRLGRLTSCGEIQYEFDADGFLRERGNEVFRYDSLGNLRKAYRLDGPGQYEIKYGYDGFGRLATRVDVLRHEVLRYLYADVTRSSRLTHVYNATSGLVTSFRYDEEGHVFAMERSDGLMWLIVSDHQGTPLAVLDSTGSTVKRIKYTPFGQVIFDSLPSIRLVIGFKGGIYDVTTGLVRFPDRDVIDPRLTIGINTGTSTNRKRSTEESSGKIHHGVEYDALIGQFTSSGLEGLADKRASGVPFLEYQVTDPVNQIPVYNHMTDTQSWLSSLGFKLNNVAPDPQIASRQKDKSSAECQLTHHLSTYMNLQTSTPSVLIPTRHTSQEVSSGTLFVQGLVMVVDRGTITTQVINDATDDVKRMSGILNGANVVIGKSADSASAAMSLTLEGKPSVYLSKPSDAFDKDRQILRISSGNDRVLDGGRDDDGSGTVASSRRTKRPIAVSLQEKRIRFESGHAVVVLTYVDDDPASDFPSPIEEKEQVLREAQRRAENEAWDFERQKIQSGIRTRWTEAEKQEIRSRHRLSSYQLRPTWDPERYPELADSGRNMRFVKVS
ncbi:teneurin-3 isoform X2 [Ciona intestinalis]